MLKLDYNACMNVNECLMYILIIMLNIDYNACMNVNECLMFNAAPYLRKACTYIWYAHACMYMYIHV